MLPWTPPASLSMQQHQLQQQQQQSHQQGNAQQNELHSIGMQHQHTQQQQHQGGLHYGGQQQQQMQQQQQQPQLQPQQQQQHMGQQQQQGIDPNAVHQQPQQQPLTLSQVLHFLQTEWRRYERERNEWEIERGEMRARIALLEGERRGTENLKTDLMRRVKMLEYALRAERNKYMTTANQQHALNKEKDAQAAQKAADDKEKERDSKEGSESSKDGSKKDGADEKEKEKPSAISHDKKKLIKEQSGAHVASGRSSPAPAASSDDAAAITTVPDVIVSTASQPNSATSAHPPAQSQQAVQRVASTASLTSLPNGQSSMTGAGAGSTMNLGPLSWNPSLGRDPRGRAKSREYLKQCLQEITYLTSATALNPLPDRTPAGLQRPRKRMVDIPPLLAAQSSVGASPQGDSLSLLPGSIPQPHSSGGNTVIPLPQPAGAMPTSTMGTVSQLNITSAIPDTAASSMPSDVAGSNPSSNFTRVNTNQVATVNTPLQPTESAPASDLTLPRTTADVFSSVQQAAEGSDASTLTADAAARLTAIFRPESSQDWKNAIQKAGQQQQQPQGNSISGVDGDVAGQTLSMKEAQAQYGQEKDALSPSNGSSVRGRSDTVQSASASSSNTAPANDADNDHKVWKPRRTLRAHLDTARCVAFDRSERSEDVSLASGGDDCTVKLWRLPLHSLAATNRSQHLPDSEPAVTYRGHTAPVTALCLTSSTASNMIYSSSLDSTILGWQMPPRDRDTYAPFDSNLNVTRLEGHTDGVWDVCLIASADSNSMINGHSSGADGRKEILASASADGTVKIWDVSPQNGDSRGSSGGALKLSWTASGTEGSEEDTAKPAPTSLALCQTDMTKLAVAYQDGIVRIFDTETGKLVLSLPAGEASTGEAAQINRIVSHPTLPMLITANEDNYIRLFDLKSGSCTHSLVGHTDAVTSLDVDPSGLTIVSASHDCTVRFWDLLQTRSCIQEIANSHRTKGDEGVLDVRYHPALPFVASSGADGGVRIYG